MKLILDRPTIQVRSRQNGKSVLGLLIQCKAMGLPMDKVKEIIEERCGIRIENL